MNEEDKAAFWERVDKAGDCWRWTGAIKDNGYGSLRLDGKTVYAHRVVLEMVGRNIPPRMVVDHMCHTPPCVNPDHLRIVTNAQNCQNKRGAHSNSKSGVRGVHWNTVARKWQVQVRHEGRRYFGGVHRSLAEAEKSAIALRNRLFTHNDADRIAS